MTTALNEADDFIELFPGLVGVEVCREIVERFERCAGIQPGAIGGGVYSHLKDSWDIDMSATAGWEHLERALNAALLTGLDRYVARYPQVILSPLMIQIPDASGQMVQLSAESIQRMGSTERCGVVTSVLRPGSINVQKYVAGVGGYPYWHSEIFPSPDGEALKRVLLWTVYLTDDFSQGETEFLHQRRLIAPKIGSLLLAPAGFTHTHRGNVPVGGDKYIATGWALFRDRANGSS
jgi:hypothetical protein